MTFEEFKSVRYNQAPWDLNGNPNGFGHEHECYSRSDISAHLPLLQLLASHGTHSTELGCRNAHSTAALITGTRGKVVSVDIAETEAMCVLRGMAERGELPSEWELRLVSSIDPNLELEETDFLFIDTLHCYRQVKEELRLHSPKVRKYIGFHDYWTDFSVSLDAGGVGIGPAIAEFLEEGNFKPIYKCDFNHGLLIVERI
jgi:hypothetical protein